LKNDVIPKLGLKLFSDIEKKLPEEVKAFNKLFPDVKTAAILEKEILKRVTFIKTTFTL
jgi:hypothetical protein